MKRICAWCDAPLDGGAAPDPEDAQPVSHGICPPCRERIGGGEGTPIQEFLDQLNAPVLLVDGDVVVRSANTHVPAMAGRSEEDVVGRLGGAVFECAPASLPDGCGRTLHCSGCAIRESVEYTHRTGSSRRVPATLRRSEHVEPQEVQLYVTTAKVGANVVLRLDPA